MFHSHTTSMNRVLADKYHEDRLLVKIKPSLQQAAAGARAMAAHDQASLISGNPALAMIDRMQRSGMIEKVTSLDISTKEDDSPRPRSAALSILGATAPTLGHRSHMSSGLSMIQASESTDLSQLHLAFADDPNVEYVSRVPIRFLAAKKKKSKKKTTRKKATNRKSSRSKSQRSSIAANPPSPLVMWNLQKIKWQQARSIGFNDASNIKVGVLDTGIDRLHPDLPTANIDYVFDYGQPNVLASDRDIIGHGTHVAGTIGAVINNSTGINGICNCNITAYKIFKDELQYDGVNGQGFEVYTRFVDPEMYLAALIRSLDDGMDVINLSIGGYGAPSPAEAAAFQDLIDNNVVVVASMGNDNTYQTSYPAGVNGAIAVGASDQLDRRSMFSGGGGSNVGSHITLCAPGSAIWSTLPTYSGDMGVIRNPSTGQSFPSPRENDYDAWPGTSMAAPHVAAAVALLKASDPSLTSSDVRSLLTSNCDLVAGMNGSSFTQEFGFGRLNLEKLANSQLA